MLRFAPSPTGDMHIGNLRAAIFNYIMAKKLGERFIIRIENTDISRNIENKDKDILEILDTFGLSYDSLIYQSNNFPRHRDLALKLIKEGRAFYCYCSKEFLDEKRKEAVDKKIAFRYDDKWAELERGDRRESPIIRLRSGDEDISFIDCIKGEISFGARELDSFVIMRNEIPTYNFACSIDDELMSLIIRGEDHISNTPKQILIKKALGFPDNVKYAHLPIILNEQNKKMSKRDSASSVKWLLEQGLEPRAIANYLILLGNSKLESSLSETFSMQECIEHFNIQRVSKTSPIFDYKKLAQINRSILRSKDIADFYPIAQSSVSDIVIDERSDELILAVVQECGSRKEIGDMFADIFSSIEHKRTLCADREKFQKILDSLLRIESFDMDYHSLKDFMIKETGLKGRDFFKPFRVVLSGRESGMELEKLYDALRQYLYAIIRR